MPVDLTNAQIRFLRGQAHDLKAILQVGGKGITDALAAEVDGALEHHELIKVKVAAEDRDLRDAMIAELAERAVAALGKVGAGEPRLQRVEFVGPQVGEEITEQGGLAMLAALIGILIYVGLRFEWRLALGSVLALFHDTIIVLGFFSVTWMDFDLTAFAAILAVIGYSLNDTIVVYDRVRENFRKVRRGSSVEIMNLSLNETLSRTVMTGVTTLLVLMSLYLYGGELLRSFTVALVVGVVFGIYSSVYVASALALALGVSRADLMPAQKEGVDARP